MQYKLQSSRKHRFGAESIAKSELKLKGHTGKKMTACSTLAVDFEEEKVSRQEEVQL